MRQKQRKNLDLMQHSVLSLRLLKIILLKNIISSRTTLLCLLLKYSLVYLVRFYLIKMMFFLRLFFYICALRCDGITAICY